MIASRPPRHYPTPTSDGLLTPWTTIALALILLVGAVMRLALVANAPAFILFGDSEDFYLAGYRLLQSGELDLPFKRAPLYPLFLAGMTALAGPYLEAAALVQHLLGLGTVALTYFLGALAFGRATGLLAALGVAINGSLLLMEHSINAEAVFTPLLLAALLLSFLALRSGRMWLYLLTGLALGFGALSRPAAQMVLPLIAVAALPQQAPHSPSDWLEGRWRPRLAAVSLLVFSFLLVVAPWVVRNHAVHGIVGISGGLGDSLVERVRRHDTGFDFHSHQAPADGQGSDQVRNRVYELAETHRGLSRLRSAVQAEFQLTEAQVDAALRAAALQVMRQQPDYYLRGTLEMFFRLLLGVDRPLEEFWVRRGDRFYVADQAIVQALTSMYQDSRTNGVVAALFALGTLRCLARRQPQLALLPAVVITQLLLYVALDGPLARYRYPMQPLITLIACGGLAYAFAWLARSAAGSWLGRQLRGLPTGTSRAASSPTAKWSLAGPSTSPTRPDPGAGSGRTDH